MMIRCSTRPRSRAIALPLLLGAMALGGPMFAAEAVPSSISSEPAAPLRGPAGNARPALSPLPSALLALRTPAWSLPSEAGEIVSRPAVASPWTPAASPFQRGEAGAVDDSGLERRLISRMQREAKRYRAETVLDPSGATGLIDSAVEEQRSRQAERIVTRAFRRTLESPLASLLRGTTTFGLLDSGAIAAAPGGAPREGLRGRLGLKLDAHPRMVVGAEFLGFRGRLEVPLLDDPVRLTLERPLGPRGSAAFTGGVGRDGREWAVLNFGFRF